MGYWNGCFSDPVMQMRSRGYDAIKWVEIENANPRLAYRTALWIEHEAYHVLHRNCEDDAYDVLRAFGLEDLTSPSLLWFPKSWFKRFRGCYAELAQFDWPSCRPEAHERERELVAALPSRPWRPTWRRPLHPHFHALTMRRLLQPFQARQVRSS